MDQVIQEIINLFSESNAVVNVSSIFMVIVYIAREVGTVYIRRKLNIKDVQIDELKGLILHQNEVIGELTAEVKSVRNGTKLLSGLVFDAFNSSKLSPDAKQLLAKNWSAIDNLMEDVAVQVTPIVIEEAKEVKENIFEKLEEIVDGKEGLEVIVDAAEDLADVIIEKAPSALEELLDNES